MTLEVIYRYRVEPGQEPRFVEAWAQCKAWMLERARGFLGASLLRRADDATQLVSISRWESLERWEAYWAEGVPDPEGEVARNELLVQLRTVARSGSRAADAEPLHLGLERGPADSQPRRGALGATDAPAALLEGPQEEPPLGLVDD